ncbi:MAG: hypothetical protein U0610_20380 [bacterium]
MRPYLIAACCLGSAAAIWFLFAGILDTDGLLRGIGALGGTAILFAWPEGSVDSARMSRPAPRAIAFPPIASVVNVVLWGTATNPSVGSCTGALTVAIVTGPWIALLLFGGVFDSPDSLAMTLQG